MTSSDVRICKQCLIDLNVLKFGKKLKVQFKKKKNKRKMYELNQCTYCKKIFSSQQKANSHVINILLGIPEEETFCYLIYLELILSEFMLNM